MKRTVDNAIIMAAGMSSRFVPLSYDLPKGLLKVRGEVLVERQIRQLNEKGVRDVTIVVGYMAERFEYLRKMFGVELVVNPDYNRYNNTATLMCVLDRLHNTYVCSSDNYFTENVFESEVGDAYYAAVFHPGASAEWGIDTDVTGKIVGIDHSPVDKWCMMGHAFFSEEFSSAFKPLLVSEFEKEHVKQGYWETVFEENVARLSMFIRKYPAGIIEEFDSLEDLRRFDVSYIDQTGSSVFARIGRELGCRDRDISNVVAQKNGIAATSFTFDCRGCSYVYSHETKTIREL